MIRYRIFVEILHLNKINNLSYVLMAALNNKNSLSSTKFKYLRKSKYKVNYLANNIFAFLLWRSNHYTLSKIMRVKKR